MTTGVVKFFNSQKGYGFIQPNEGGADVFVHVTALEQAGLSILSEGQKVAFEVVRDPRNGKMTAANIDVS